MHRLASCLPAPEEQLPLFSRAYLSPVYRVLARNDLVSDVWRLEDYKSKAPWAPVVPVVADKGLPHYAIVLKVCPQLFPRSLPAEPAYKDFRTLARSAVLVAHIVFWRNHVMCILVPISG